jgi:hypothetical protein
VFLLHRAGTEHWFENIVDDLTLLVFFAPVRR